MSDHLNKLINGGAFSISFSQIGTAEEKSDNQKKENNDGYSSE